ncbi:MAG: NAD-dependent epimerase/dehydratase family protein [Coriobacteriales bacterium]|nr:NAD-dependent epimerase/dehydratase family protein [Coriobacteriales bacterium]
MSSGKIGVKTVAKDDIAYLQDSFKKNDIFSNSVIVITGFAGFLGYYFCHYFLSLDIKRLVLIDNFIIRMPAWVAHVKQDARVSVIDADIAKLRYEDYTEFSEADYVIHMASIASPVFYRRYPIETINANVLGLRGLLEFYKDYQSLQGLLFFSSSEIYGDPDPDFIPTEEDYRGNVSCVGPRACYDESKRIGETLCYCYAQQYGMPIGVARPFNNYGPGMDINDKRAPADFARAVIAGEDIVLFSDGSPKRTFCYVTDAIDGYLRVLIHGSYDYFNIGMDNPEITIRELAEIFRESAANLLGYSGQVRLEEPDDTDYLTHNPNRRCPDINKAKRLLGYNPRILVQDGVGNYLRFLNDTML